MNNDFQLELLNRTRAAMEQRIKIEKAQPKVQYNIVIEVTPEQAAAIVGILTNGDKEK